MKSASILLVTLVVLTLAATASADVKGWGLGAGSYDGEFGVQGRKEIRLGGDISHLTAQGSVVFANRTTFALDADYHFDIKSGNGRFYPLAGVNFAFNSDDTEFGVNGGGGIKFMFTDKLAGFGEFKYVFFGWEGWFITGGIYF